MGWLRLSLAEVETEKAQPKTGHSLSIKESRFPKRKSNEYEEEYGLILYNATWILDNQSNFVWILKSCMVENKIEIMPFLYNAAPIPGHLLTRKKFGYHSCTMQLSFLDIYQQNKHLTSSFGNVIVQDSCRIVQE